MVSFQGLALWQSVALFSGSAAIITWCGVQLARIADELADRTGMGEVIAGALFVGAATSLPGAVTSVVTAAQGAASLAVGNALGGLTAQTAFIAVADLFYRRANLEHAAASPTGLAQGVLLLILLILPLIAASQPPVTVWGIHPVSLLIPVTYVFGLRLLAKIHEQPMWRPVATDETREEISEPDFSPGSLTNKQLWMRFALNATATALAGYVIGEASIAIVQKTDVSETAMGTIFTAVSNSLPELVTAIAAVRIGAVNLAFGDVIGGNAFEVMFLCAADLVHSGSIYGAMTGKDHTTALIAMLMTSVMLIGMIRRQKSGPGNIGFESALVLLLYGVSVVLVLA